MADINTIIRDFNRKFRTDFTIDKVTEIERLLKLDGIDKLNNILICLVFSYFENQRFKLTKEIQITTLSDAVITCVTKSLKNSIKYENTDFIIWIKNKFREGYDPEGSKVHVCEKSDICIADKRLNRLYCIAEAVRQNLSNKLLADNIVISYQIPIEVKSNFLKELLHSPKIDIHEIDCINIIESDITDFYLKAGSKKSRINKKIEIIINKVLKTLRPFNIRSLLVGCKDAKTKERIRIALRPEGFNNYRLEIQTKNPHLKLKLDIESILKKEGVEFSKSVRFIDEPIEEKIIALINKRKINGLSTFKEEVKKWDIYNFLKIGNNKIRVLEKEVIKQITFLMEDNLEKKEVTFKKENLSIKGFIFKRREDGRPIFFFINHGKSIDQKRITLLSSDKKIPFFFVSLKKKAGEYRQEILFTEINKIDKRGFIRFVNEIIDYPQIFQNIKKNFDKSYDELKTIENKLSKITNSQRKGEVWERVCLGILDYVFKETIPLSRTYLPDGKTIFQEDESILWDAKGLIRGTTLKKSVLHKKSGQVKDTFYINAFKNKQFNFKFYTYLTIGVSKDDFEKVKIKAEKRLIDIGIKDVKIVCITKKWINSLASYFKSIENSSRIHKNLNELTSIIKEEFRKEYLENLDLSKLDKIGKNKEINEHELRKEVKELMEKS